MGWLTLALTHARTRRWLGLHFERQLGPDREARLRRHMARCVECRSLYMALALARGPETTRQRHQRIRDSGQPEFRERGSLTSGEDPAGASRFVSISVYRLPAHEQGALQPVRHGGAISRGDRLAFAYTNRSEEGFDRLLLFGVDEQHVVYWFYPAWTDPEQLTPRAVSIRHGRGVELPEEVAHDYEGSSLRLFALFFSGSRDLSVRSIEAVVQQLKERKVHVKRLQHFPLQETGQHTILLRVTDR